MKVGDLVTLAPKVMLRREQNFAGFIIDFDEDNDPIVQWFLKGNEIFVESEYRSQIKVISEA
tara:strand:+ start:627 stop:812 length:186 start_codon:yes stop_codon:yes gene_type:complete